MRLFTPRQLGPISPYSGTDTASSPAPQPERQEAVPPAAAPAWDGNERRSGVDRRQQGRRQAQQGTLLDTRCGGDRRQQGRRASDASPWSRLKI
ncbi:MAG TPA: hypothetical protein VLC08_06615 [Chitinolyticbacter sp.]|uniref:hypothetical protein n=1 Tax=Chitinolyticbacter albus TaxID=2961951 RepID=UPI00210E0538|nr:hypothetical protein [Chitinolyticbacter albus]HSC80006.1 hypothetical protein [Chitinolyticbacter sp.]